MKLCLYPAHVDIPWVQSACPKLFELLTELGVTPEPDYDWNGIPSGLPAEPCLVWISSQLTDRPWVARESRKLGHIPFYSDHLVTDHGEFGGVEALLQRVQALTAGRPAS